MSSITASLLLHGEPQLLKPMVIDVFLSIKELCLPMLNDPNPNCRDPMQSGAWASAPTCWASTQLAMS